MKNTTLRRRSWLATPLLLLASACSSGGDGAVVLTPEAQALVDEWILVRRAEVAGAVETDALPLTIEKGQGGRLTLVLGANAETEIRLSATLVGDKLLVSGADQFGSGAGFFRLEVIEAVWAVSSDGDAIGGVMEVLRTVGAESPVRIVDTIEAFRVDAALAQGPLVDDWDWAIAVAESDCATNRLAGETLKVRTLHLDGQRFVATLEIPGETEGTFDEFQIELELDGATNALRMFGADTDDGETLEVFSSELTFVDDLIAGTVVVGFKGAEDCVQTLIVTGVREGATPPGPDPEPEPDDPEAPETFHLYVQDTAGLRALMAVDPRDPLRRMELDRGVAGARGAVAGGVFDAETGRTDALHPRRFYYLRGEDLVGVDLAIERDEVTGAAKTPSLHFIERDIEGTVNQMKVFPDIGGDLVGAVALQIDFEWHWIQDDGEGNGTLEPLDGEPLIDIVNPQTGELDGLLVQSEGPKGAAFDDLVRVNRNHSVDPLLFAQFATSSSVLRTADGAIFFFTGDGLKLKAYVPEGDGFVRTVRDFAEENEINPFQGSKFVPFGDEVFLINTVENDEPAGSHFVNLFSADVDGLTKFFQPDPNLFTGTPFPRVRATPERILFQLQDGEAVHSTKRDGSDQREIGSDFSLSSVRILGETMAVNTSDSTARILDSDGGNGKTLASDAFLSGLVPARSRGLVRGGSPEFDFYLLTEDLSSSVKRLKLVDATDPRATPTLIGSTPLDFSQLLPSHQENGLGRAFGETPDVLFWSEDGIVRITSTDDENDDAIFFSLL